MCFVFVCVCMYVLCQSHTTLIEMGFCQIFFISKYARHSFEEVSGLNPGHNILKLLKIVPTATLFGAEHIRV